MVNSHVVGGGIGSLQLVAPYRMILVLQATQPFRKCFQYIERYSLGQEREQTWSRRVERLGKWRVGSLGH
jgi:hypothetical protein